MRTGLCFSLLTTLVIVFCLFALSTASEDIDLAQKGAAPDAAPTLTWSVGNAPSVAGYGVELSLDSFQSVLYSTYAATGRALQEQSWAMPLALWSYLAKGTPVQWRVVSLDGSGATIATTNAGAFTPSGDRAAAAGADADRLDFSKASKLARAGADAAFLDHELLAAVPIGRENELYAALASIAFPIERDVTAQGRVLVRLQTAIALDSVQATVQGRAALPGTLYDASGAPQREAFEGDIVLQPNYVYHASLTPTDPFWASWPRYQYEADLIHAHDAWAAGITGSGVIVAVIDTGVNVSTKHQELDGAGKLIAGPDYVNDDIVPDDDHGHGSHVAGTIAAEADATGMVGIAPEAKILACKALDASGSGSTGDIAQCIDYAVSNGARVINMSLGANVFALLPEVLGLDFIREMAIRNAAERGVVTVCAAGNDNASLPARPAGFSDAIYVGAVSAEDELTTFSNCGPWVSVVAPGRNLYSLSNSSSTEYTFKSGTSMATPVTAGVVALILSSYPALTPRQVRELLEDSADDLGAAGRDDFYGYGRVNVAKALGLTPGASTMPPSLKRIEMSTTKMIATFSADMATGGSVNAIDNPANWLMSDNGGFVAFISGASLSYNATTHQLTFENNTNTITFGNGNAFIFTANCLNATGSRRILCNNATSGQQGAAAQNWAGLSISQGNGYAQAVATNDGGLQVLFRYPVTEATAENSANYTLNSDPAYDGGTGKSTGGTAVSLVGTSLDYSTATRLLTISNLPTPMDTLGTTFRLELGSGIKNADLNNSIYPAWLDPSCGVVVSPISTLPALVAVDNSMLGNDMREIIRLVFNKPMRTDAELFDRANYSVTINGTPRANPADMEVVTSAGTSEIVLTGWDLSSDGGLGIDVTVNNLQDYDGNVIAGANRTASGTLAAGADFGPELMVVTGSPNSIFVQFSYWTKMDQTSATTPANWTLLSDAVNPPTTGIDLSGASFAYDSVTNRLGISGLSLTAGHYFTLTAGAPVVKRYPTQFTFSTPGVTAVVGGNGDFSPPTPTAAYVKAGPLNPQNQINSSNWSNVNVDVTVPADAVAGQVVKVAIVDRDTPAAVVTGTATLLSGGAQTVTVSGMDVTGMMLGSPMSVQAMLIGSSGDGASDVFIGTETDTTLPVELSVFGIE
ncbi:MAG TPA: S8 family serine peptidase [Candidatus Hydrogenedentes bacterium]|nr:S8 family serine peptidase [Candidatus Hydrogenedentota bacterium]HPG68721.1 S8 family serine peptidase [Candidatus Hydrogenedentota bacterium]